MSVYIKGMEMPVFEHQSWDIRKGADGKWYMVDTNAETSDGAWHEIVPVPDHGRLIDADALIEKCEEMADDGDGNQLDALVFLRWFFEQKAPTIIPASTADKEAE